ncbi:Hypothetical_protein [Hexamita inflata]|uniref:Hypothetical_protein n=1 Tax=Hexamita inflata TaxID=28002 RepID=A0ABP1JIC2_9EUKA
MPLAIQSLTAAQHFDLGDFTFHNRFSRTVSQKAGCGDEREAQLYEPIIDHAKQSWYFSNASSALTSDSGRRAQSFKIIYFFILRVWKWGFQMQSEEAMEHQIRDGTEQPSFYYLHLYYSGLILIYYQEKLNHQSNSSRVDHQYASSK